MVTIAPVALAKVLGIKPQIIYSLMKRSKIKSYPGTKSQEVDPDEVRKILSSPGKPRRLKVENESEDRTPSPLKKNQIVTWGTRKGKQIAQVKRSDDILTDLENIRKEEITFRNTSLKKLLADKVITIENPMQLLEMVMDAFAAGGNEQLAESLKALVNA